jgi:hypothetical protein
MPALMAVVFGETRVTLPGQGEPVGGRPVHYLMRLGISVTPVSGITATPAPAGTLTLDSCEGQESGHCGTSESCQLRSNAPQQTTCMNRVTNAAVLPLP